MADVVALDVEGGARFVDLLRRIWDAGAAVAPLDPNLPQLARQRVLAAIAPTGVMDETGAVTPCDGGRPTDDGDALVMATSGTTGDPRGVVLTHDALAAAAYASATALGIAPDVRWLACLPLHHIGGFSAVTRALVTGAGLEVHPRFDPDAVAEAARRGATHVSLVATALRRIDAAPFRRILLGGSAPPAAVPSNVVTTYGLTESGAGVVYDGLALNGVGLRIGADDHIELSGPTMLRCYRDGVDPKDERGWFRTGDLGRVEASTGLLTVWGRADDVVITGGEKVWPDEVEAVLSLHPGVREVAVIPRDDAEWGQVVTAVVVPMVPTDPPTLDDLRAMARESLPRHCAPKRLELATSLPRSRLGKVQRRLLRTPPPG